VTNRPGPGERPVGSITVVLLDGVNTELKDQQYARQQLLKFLRQIRPEDRVAVYSLGAKLRVLNDFTNDPRRLTAAVARLSGDNLGITVASDVSAAAVSQLPDDAITLALQAQAQETAAKYNVDARVALTVGALEAISRHLAGIPGRKNLIWITDGFPLALGDTPGDQKTYDSETLRASRALNDANIAIYPVDATGLKSMNKAATAEGNYGRTRAQAVGPAASLTVSLATTANDAMHHVAANTGGIVFENSNDLQKAIRTAADDGEATYTLGFYPDPADLDSQFHDLKVQVRRKDVEVRYRRGFVALPDAAITGKERADAIREALQGPLQASAIGLTAGSEKGDQPGSLRVVVSIEPRDISLEQKDGKWNAVLDLAFSQRSSDGRELGASTTPLGISLDQSKRNAIFQQGLSITKTVDLAPGVAEIRVLVSDRATGKIGSLILGVK
jgi:VWFA-related protein